MTIDDELILEIIKPDSKGRVTEKGLIAAIMGTKEISYKIEQSTSYLETTGSSDYDRSKTEIVRITPDLTIKIGSSKKGLKAAVTGVMKEALVGPKLVAFELENDIHWDFQESLRQIKKYKRKFKDTRIIIPCDFRRFAPLYKHEGFRVYLWKAKRKWQCLKCEAETSKEGPVNPKCPKCSNLSPNDFRLVGLESTKIEEFQ